MALVRFDRTWPDEDQPMGPVGHGPMKIGRWVP
ncbi:hypothetical protein STRAU_4505 [Streptomyces aurantiacus JA 4570]|uniref:Uncharacterized protein n=1 Tax=Streptomyces aurantiacus JA 4570 TaxID=1286094 RepID=S4ALW9_9ACTN|nr:hypothetical protein STRAU_4505 [Streptomyces aurantiacus JA 4570]